MSGISSVLKRINNSKNVKNSFWIIGEQVFQIGLSLIVGMLSARYLGPSNYGTLNYTASFVSFFINIASLCMEGVVVKKLIEYPNKEGTLLGSCLIFRIVASSLSMISIEIIICLLNPGDKLKFTLALLQSLQLFFKAFNILDAWFQRYLKSKYTSIGKMIASLSVSTYKIILLITAKSVIWFAFASTLSDLIIAIMLMIFYIKENGQKFAVRYRVGKEVLSESYHFIISDIMAALYMNIDRVMIGKMLDDKAVGFYMAASTVSTIWSFVPIALINSYRPTIIELKKHNELLYKKRLTQLFSIVIWGCVFFSLMTYLFSNFLVHILYGDEYMEATAALKVLAWSQLFVVVSLVRSVWILCEQKNKYVKYYATFGTVVNGVLNYFMISSRGIVGASLATLITSVVVLVFAPLFFKETRGQTRFLVDGFFLSWLYKRN